MPPLKLQAHVQLLTVANEVADYTQPKMDGIILGGVLVCGVAYLMVGLAGYFAYGDEVKPRLKEKKISSSLCSSHTSCPLLSFLLLLLDASHAHHKRTPPPTHQIKGERQRASFLPHQVFRCGAGKGGSLGFGGDLLPSDVQTGKGLVLKSAQKQRQVQGRRGWKDGLCWVHGEYLGGGEIDR